MCQFQNCINHRTAEDFVSNEFGEEDLVTAFKQPISTEILAVQNKPVADFADSFNSSIVDKVQNQQQDAEDYVDMEYFRF